MSQTKCLDCGMTEHDQPRFCEAGHEGHRFPRCPLTCPHGDRCRLAEGHEQDGFGCNHGACPCNEPNAVPLPSVTRSSSTSGSRGAFHACALVSVGPVSAARAAAAWCPPTFASASTRGRAPGRTGAAMRHENGERPLPEPKVEPHHAGCACDECWSDGKADRARAAAKSEAEGAGETRYLVTYRFRETWECVIDVTAPTRAAALRRARAELREAPPGWSPVPGAATAERLYDVCEARPAGKDRR